MNLNDIKVCDIGLIRCAGKRDEAFRQWREIMMLARRGIGGTVPPCKPEKN